MTFKRILLTSFACLLIQAAAVARQQTPELFTYDELVQLYEQETPPDQNSLRLSEGRRPGRDTEEANA